MQLWWSKWIFLVCIVDCTTSIISILTVLCLLSFLVINICIVARSSACFSIGWPMHDDCDFFKSTSTMTQVLLIQLNKIVSIWAFCYFFHKFPCQGKRGLCTAPRNPGKLYFTETRSSWHIFRSFDRLWTFFILVLQVCINNW